MNGITSSEHLNTPDGGISEHQSVVSENYPEHVSDILSSGELPRDILHASTPKEVSTVFHLEWESKYEVLNTREVSQVFDKLMTAILCVEIIDILERINHLYPVKDLDSLKQKLRGTKNRHELMMEENNIWSKLPNLIEIPDESSMDCVITFINRTRNCAFDLHKIMFTLSDWILRFSEYKFRNYVDTASIGGVAYILTQIKEEKKVFATCDRIAQEIEDFGGDLNEFRQSLCVMMEGISRFIKREQEYYFDGKIVQSNEQGDVADRSEFPGQVFQLFMRGADIAREVEIARNILKQIIQESLKKHIKAPISTFRKLFSGGAPVFAKSMRESYEQYASGSILLSETNLSKRFMRDIEQMRITEKFWIKNTEIPEKQEQVFRLFTGVQKQLQFALAMFEYGKIKDFYNPLGYPVIKSIIAKVNKPTGKEIMFADRCLYFDSDTYRTFPQAPPSSSTPNALRLEVATGCSWNRCTYCDLYTEEKFWLTKTDDFREHVQKVKKFLGDAELSRFDRMFLTGGNALSLPTSRFLEILSIIKKEFGSMRRIECYATTGDILKKGPEDLAQLREAGLNLVYWGIESGSDEVLEYVNKQHRHADIIRAGEYLNTADIRASATIMPGLGGVKYSESHIIQTANVLEKVQPQYITLMGVDIVPTTEYAKMMNGSTENRPLTKEELEEQGRTLEGTITNLLRKRSDYKFPIKVAAYASSVTPTANNAHTFVRVI